MGKNNDANNAEKTTKEIVKKSSVSSIVKWIIILVCLIVLVGGVYLVVDKTINKDDSKQVSSVLIQKKLESASELITSKLTLKGYVNHTNKGIAFINEDSFFMTYEGVVKAGIDIKKVEVSVNDKTKTVTVKIPESEIMSVDIDDDTIKYLNQNFAFFKGDQKEQAIAARKLAKKDMRKQAKKTGLLTMADKQSKTLITGLLKETVGDYKIKCVNITEKKTDNTSNATKSKTKK